MKYLSVCSGIEAATTAWHSLGWTPVAFSEVEPFPSAVLAHHWPEVPNLGDMTKYEHWNIAPDSIDLLVGGTPCQSFSVAGLRKGLRDSRGGLMLTYLEIAQRLRPRWVVWENVPGVLSSNGGRDFGSFLGALGELGYGWAYRVLDAQWFGVAQRRRRVFVVGCLGDAAGAAAVLFESESVRRHSPPRREEGEEPAPSLRTRAPGSGGQGADWGHVVAHTLAARSGSSLCAPDIQTYLPWPAQTVPTLNAHFGEKQGLEDQHILAGARLFTPVAFDTTQITSAVRRLTPRECERLQGFPDDHTLIPWRGKPADQCPDGPRYKAIGNSMAVPVMRWIGERIRKAHIDSIL